MSGPTRGRGVGWAEGEEGEAAEVGEAGWADEGSVVEEASSAVVVEGISGEAVDEMVDEGVLEEVR